MSEKHSNARICAVTSYVLWDSIDYAQRSLHILTKEQQMSGIGDDYVRLAVERVITNIHQLVKAYTLRKLPIKLELSPIEQESYTRLEKIRQLLDHAYTNFDQIDEQFESRCASLRVGPRMAFMHHKPNNDGPTLTIRGLNLRYSRYQYEATVIASKDDPSICPPQPTGCEQLFTNGFGDDWKFFYGKNFLFLRRDIIRLLCRLTVFANKHLTDENKILSPFKPVDYFSLLSAEKEPPVEHSLSSFVINNGTFHFTNMTLDLC